ncbi:MAG: hypothetical protein K0R75_283 [Paenibacillaceae bacterium]|nr:hypothetical protein [Paenibacillaceae bacterium]
MTYSGVILHHSVCPKINGKGYDFFITEQAGIIPATLRTDPNYIHICLEGDFSTTPPTSASKASSTAASPTLPHSNVPDRALQLFMLNKLLLRLSARFGFPADSVFVHSPTCPGTAFPWSELVISATDGYH